MYFVIYDLNDNVIAYCDSIDELIIFLDLKTPKKVLNSRWKRKEYSFCQFNNSYYKVYKFS